MPPTFVGAGSGVERLTTGSATVSKTGCTAGNIIVFHLHVLGATEDWGGFVNEVNVEALDGGDNDSTTIRTGSNFQIVAGRAMANGTCSADFTVGASGEDIIARVYEFSGGSLGTTAAAVFENGAGVTDFDTGTGTSIGDAGVTTSGSDRLAINFLALESSQAIGSFTGETGGDWTEAVAEYSGTTMTLQVQTAAKASAGTLDGGTYTVGASTTWLSISTALLPSAPTGVVSLPLSFSVVTRSETGASSAVPVFVGAGTGVERLSPGALTVSKTGCTAGNLLVLHMHVNGTGSDKGGFSGAVNIESIDGVDNETTVLRTGVDFQIAVGRVMADGTCSAQVTVGASGEDIAARIYEFSGEATASVLEGVFENGTGLTDSAEATDANPSAAPVVTNGDDRLALNLLALDSAQALDSFTGETGADWVEATAEYVGSTITLQLQTAVLGSAMTFHGGSDAVGASTPWLSIATAIQPGAAPPGAGGSSTSRNVLTLGVG